jgi:hypothetical protein
VKELDTWPAKSKVGYAARRADCGVEMALGLFPGMDGGLRRKPRSPTEVKPHIETEHRSKAPRVHDKQHHLTLPPPTNPPTHRKNGNSLTLPLSSPPTNTQPALHLRHQLPRIRPRHPLPQILLRPGPPSLHFTHVEIPHPRDRTNRQPRREADKQPRGRIGGNAAGLRFARPAAEQHQEAERYGHV